RKKGFLFDEEGFSFNDKGWSEPRSTFHTNDVEPTLQAWSAVLLMTEQVKLYSSATEFYFSTYPTPLIKIKIGARS
ncbi:MAG TPA: hypothetical protein VGH42_06200, partial [Verrucomicrobiae bacterium]